MAITTLDLLQEDTAFDATPASGHRLRTVQLAIGALRTDLDSLTRQRCYAVYLLRQLCWMESPPEHRIAEPLFELDHCAPMPLEDISALSPSQLLIAQFGPGASDSLTRKCGEHFLLKASAARHSKRKGRTPPLAEFTVRSLKLEKAGGESTETASLALLVGSGALVVLQEGEDEIWACAAEQITEVVYLAGERVEEDGISKQNCSLQVNVNSYHRLGKAVSAPSKVTLALGPLASRAVSFITLRKTIKGWQGPACDKFPLSATEIDGRPRQRSPLPTEPTSTRESDRRSRDSTRKRDRSPSVASRDGRRSREPRRLDETRDSHRSSDSTRRREGVSDGARSVQRSVVEKPAWLNFLSDTRSQPEGTPAFFTRQAALLRAIDPSADQWLAPLIPVFNHYEIVFLNFRANGDLLPRLPRAADDSFRYNPHDRLALEAIYNAGSTYIDISQTRWLLSGESRDDPVGFEENLLTYVAAVRKIIQCREEFKTVWGMLSRDLERALKDRPTDDSLHNTIALVNKLHASEDFRTRFFTENGQVIRSVTAVSPRDIGTEPYQRFVKLVEECYDYEKKLRGILLPVEGRG